MITDGALNSTALINDWYVLQLKPNGLKIAETNLARQGYETLMPMREVTQPSRHGLQRSKRPLFPGYLFCASADGQINWRAVANTRGVARVVTGTAGQPAQLPSQVAHDLLLATAQSGMLMAIPRYQPGDPVNVINGPFAGWLAKVVAADDEGRIQLLVDLMGRKTQVNIAGEDVERRQG